MLKTASQLRFLASKAGQIPKPTAEVPDVQAFLTKIGRNTMEHAETFPNWDSLFTLNGAALKAAGVEVNTRRYILDQVQRFRMDGSVREIKRSKKLNGGERKLNQHLANKKVLDRIELAKTQKIIRKQDNASSRLESRFDKLHTQLNNQL